MKSAKITLLYLAFFLIGNAYSQTGINSKSPKATFDISAKNLTDTSTEGLLIPRISRLKAQSMETIETSTLVYIDNITQGTNTGKAIDIDATGYYYYNGTKWIKLSIANLNVSNGITNTNGNIKLGGTLTEVTTINTNGTNRLSITGNSANNFSVSGANSLILSTDAEKDFLGIKTNSPTHPLDVNGKIRVRNTELLPSNDVSSLYVDSNGVIGRSNVSNFSPLTYFSASNQLFNITTDFNAGNTIVVPMRSSEIILNTLNFQITNNHLTIKEAGVYQITGSTNLALSTTAANENIYVAINIQKSSDNGANWTSISGLRPVYSTLGVGNFNYSTTLPTALVPLEQNDLIRMVLYRTSTNTSLQGVNITNGQLGNQSLHGTKGYTLLISKF